MRAAALLLSACVACGGSTDSEPGSSSGGGSGGSGGGGSGGSGPLESACWQAAVKWHDALDLAKTCDPLVDENECVVLSYTAAHCGCSTYVGSTNQSAIDTLATLKDQLPAECAESPCVGCAVPSAGVCQFTESGGAHGRCQDVY